MNADPRTNLTNWAIAIAAGVVVGVLVASIIDPPIVVSIVVGVLVAVGWRTAVDRLTRNIGG